MRGLLTALVFSFSVVFAHALIPAKADAREGCMMPKDIIATFKAKGTPVGLMLISRDQALLYVKKYEEYAGTKVPFKAEDVGGIEVFIPPPQYGQVFVGILPRDPYGPICFGQFVPSRIHQVIMAYVGQHSA